jgi:hypothetical protein
MRFEERELKSYAEPVTSNLLTEGEVYFSVQFADEDMLIPILEAWVFAGRKLDPKDVEGHLYFQDLASYRQGIRYASATAENASFQLRRRTVLSTSLSTIAPSISSCSALCGGKHSVRSPVSSIVGAISH